MSVTDEQLIEGAEQDHTERHRIIDELTAERIRQGLSIEAVAERMGVKPLRVYAIEEGMHDPYHSALQRYARALGGRLFVDIELPDPAAPQPPVGLTGVWESKDPRETRFIYVLRIEGSRAVAIRCDRRGMKIPGHAPTRYQLNADGTALKRYRRPAPTA